MDSGTDFPAAYRIGGLEYEYSDDPAVSVADGWGETERHDSPIFSLSVGPSKTAYFVHQAVLCKSPVFKGFCTSGLRESQTRHIDLPEDDLNVIGHLIDYLYVGYVLEYQLEGNESADRLASIYVAADKYEVDDLKGDIVGYFKDCECLPLMSEEGFLRVSRYIYENTPESDKVYKAFFMDVACAWFEDETKDLNSHVEPYLRQGDLLAYDIYQAQLRVSMQRKKMYQASEKLRKRSEVLHKREHYEDQAQIALLTAQKRLFRKYFHHYQYDHHSSHPECEECGSRDRI